MPSFYYLNCAGVYFEDFNAPYVQLRVLEARWSHPVCSASSKHPQEKPPSSICSSGVGCIPVSCSKSMKWLMGLWHLMATIWHVMNWKEVSRSDKRPIPDTQLSPRYGQRSRLRPGKLTKRLRLLVGCKGKDFGKNPELYPALNTCVCANKHAGNEAKLLTENPSWWFDGAFWKVVFPEIYGLHLQ